MVFVQTSGSASVDHVARPLASEVSIFPTHGAPHVIFICPATSSFAHGLCVPIPTSPELLRVMIVLQVIVGNDESVTLLFRKYISHTPYGPVL